MREKTIDPIKTTKYLAVQKQVCLAIQKIECAIFYYQICSANLKQFDRKIPNSNEHSLDSVFHSSIDLISIGDWLS